MAGELGFEYNLVDAAFSGATRRSGQGFLDMIRELVDYSRQPLPGVKIWVWKAYPDDRVLSMESRPRNACRHS
ncbi:MAG: hypothetical protein ACLTZY_04865 [Alistipes indistinctus]